MQGRRATTSGAGAPSAYHARATRAPHAVGRACPLSTLSACLSTSTSQPSGSACTAKIVPPTGWHGRLSRWHCEVYAPTSSGRHGNFLRPTGRRGCARARPQRSGEVYGKTKKKVRGVGVLFSSFRQKDTGHALPHRQARRGGRQSLAAGNLSPQTISRRRQELACSQCAPFVFAVLHRDRLSVAAASQCGQGP